MLLDFLKCPSCGTTLKSKTCTIFYDDGKTYKGHYCVKCVPVGSLSKNDVAYLQDILDQPNLVCTPEGWKANGPLKKLKCPLCQEEFTRKGKMAPVLMWGNYHLQCKACYEKYRAQQRCKVCQRNCGPSRFEAPIVGQYLEFTNAAVGLEEAEVGIEWWQGPGSAQSTPTESPHPMELDIGSEKCGQCLKTYLLDQLFNCEDCKITLCGLCVVRKHRDHNLIDVGALKIANLEAATTAQLNDHFVGLHQMVVHIHSEITASSLAFNEAVVKCLKLVGREVEYANGSKICLELRSKMERFEDKFEKYLPQARIYEEDLKKLKEAIDSFVLELKPE
ncbi:unnamed protein product, partial [Mesorhabditis spiculigera]